MHTECIQILPSVILKIHGMQAYGRIQIIFFGTEQEKALPACPIHSRQDLTYYSYASGPAKDFLPVIKENVHVYMTVGIDQLHN